MTTRDGKYAMIFATESSADGVKRVESFRAGYAEPVGYIEGCA